MRRVLSSVINAIVQEEFTDILEEYTASIFRVEEEANLCFLVSLVAYSLALKIEAVCSKHP
jgi:hypothetical protein